MKENPIKIKYVQPDSAAYDAGIEQGDLLLSINGLPIRDMFDYRFNTVNESLNVAIQKKDGEFWEIDIEKDEYEELGLEFDDPLMDEAKSCTNNCIFCFIDQLPKGMRSTVYFKDDDSRLSFLSGNYVTLTNVKDDEIERIVRYKMSPINVSVHTTDPELRKYMLRNRFAGDVLDKIRKLIGGGITVNAQIVLCRGINDCERLDRTISDLTGLYPGIGSISVVPVGLTKWRQGLYELTPFDRETSRQVILQIEEWQKKLLDRFDSRVVYAADEFYIMSETELPSYEDYEDFPQIENGVGLVSLLMHEFDEYLSELDGLIMNSPIMEGSERLGVPNPKNEKQRHISIATGTSVFKYINEMASKLQKRYNYLKIEVFPIKNKFFGENVTVTGLLTGGDIVEQLSGKELGSELLISRSMLRSGEEILLDDYTVSEIAEKLGTKVTVVDNGGRELVDAILETDLK